MLSSAVQCFPVLFSVFQSCPVFSIFDQYLCPTGGTIKTDMNIFTFPAPLSHTSVQVDSLSSTGDVVGFVQPTQIHVLRARSDFWLVCRDPGLDHQTVHVSRMFEHRHQLGALVFGVWVGAFEPLLPDHLLHGVLRRAVRGNFHFQLGRVAWPTW